MNHMRKRLVLTMLSGLLAVSLVSCLGGGEDASTDSQAAETESTAASTTDTEEVTAAPTETVATADGSPIEFPVVP